MVIFNSGLDSSLNTFSVAFLCFQAVGLHDSVFIPLILISIQSIFYFAAWEENVTHKLRYTLGGVGPDEFAFISMAIYLLTYIYGYEFWLIELYGIRLNEYYGGFVFICFSYGVSHYLSFTLLYQRSLKSLMTLLPLFQVYLGLYLIYQTQVYQTLKVLFLFEISSLFGVLCV